MYGPLLAIHSWLRWVVLFAAVAVLVRRRNQPWDRGDDRWASSLVGLVDVQVTFGLVLWLFASPLTHLAFSERMLFKGATFTFFGLFHPTVMLAALTWLHIAKVKAKKSKDRDSWRFAVLIFLAGVLLAIPWPFWSFGRALFYGVTP